MKRLNFRSKSGTYLPCILSGLLLGLSYPSYPYVRLEVLAWVWMVPLLLSLRQVRSLPRFLGRVYLAAFVVCVFGMSWLITSTLPGALLLFVVGAVIFTVPFACFYFIRNSFGWRAALWSAPVVWTAWDWLYQRSEGSFGWLTMSVTQSNLYGLVQYIDITGVWGITFWLVLFNVLVVMAVEDWLTERARTSDTKRAGRFLARRLIFRLAFVSALMLAAPLAYTAYVFSRKAQPPGTEGRELSVLLVQPNVNSWEKAKMGARAGVLRKTIGLTNRALAGAETKPDLIIWPETAVPYVLSEDKDARETVYRGVARWQTPLLTGLWDARTERQDASSTTSASAPPATPRKRELFNSAALFSPVPAAPGRRLNVERSAIYHKRVLVPFVERVPFVDRFPALQSLALEMGAGDAATPGREPIVFSVRTQRGDEVKVAAAICYEYLYPTEVADLVREGAQMLALITNDGWYSQTHGAHQLAAFSRLRAIETRRTVARVANTGVTALIDHYGRIYQQSPWWSEQSLAGRVALSDELSLYVRYPDYFPHACAWLSLALLVAAAGVSARAFLRSFQAPPSAAAGWVEPERGSDLQRINAQLCRESHSTSPRRGRLTIAQQFTAGIQAKEIQSVQRTVERDRSGRLLSTVRFTDCDFVFGVIPAMNRWAIPGRPPSAD